MTGLSGSTREAPAAGLRLSGAGGGIVRAGPAEVKAAIALVRGPAPDIGHEDLRRACRIVGHHCLSDPGLRDMAALLLETLEPDNA